MALSLVSYDDSDESDTEVDSTNGGNLISSKPVSSLTSTVPSKLEVKTTTQLQEDSTIQFSDEEETEVPARESDKALNIFLPESKVTSLNTDIDIKQLTSSNKRNGPVKITIPSLNEIEEDVEQAPKKKLKPSQKGSGLFALLPSPKTSLVPQSVVNKNRKVPPKPSKPLPPKQINSTPPKIIIGRSALTSIEDSGDEYDSSDEVDFFSLDSKVEELPVPEIVDIDAPKISQSTVTTEPARNLNEQPLNFSSEFQSNWSAPSTPQPSSSVHQPAGADLYTTSEFMSVPTNNLQLDDDAMQQLCGRRDRLKGQEMNIIDVSGDAIMPDSREWLTKQLTEEQPLRPSHKKRDGPTSQQKRKHQITYLAFQAKENELELKNQWSNNRMTRKQTQSKYGF